MVESAVPFHCTVAPERKLVPLTVKVNPVPPAVAEVGLRLVIVGVGALMGNATAVNGVPDKLTAVMLALPALAIKLAGTAAVSCAELTNVVVSAVPFHCTLAPERKLVPLTVSVNPAPPAVAEVGLRLVIAGVGALMGNATAVDGVPDKLTAVMLALPALAIKLAGTAAVNCAELTNVVVSAVPFHCTVAPERKPVPLTVNVNPAPPAVAEVGLRLVIVGVGALMGNATAVDGVPDKLTAVMLALPALAIKLAGTAAVNCAELTNVVVSPVPFHCTVAPERKLVPLTVNVNPAPPAVAEVGLRLVIVAVGALMGNATAVDGVPPVLTAVMLALPALAIKLAGTVAVNCAELTNVVESPVPFHCTVAPERKLVPLTVNVNPAPPAIAEVGLKLLIVGVGALMGNATAVDGVPPVLTAVMLALPALAIKLAGTAAVNCAELTNVVVRAVPFHCTVAPVRKLVPLTVRVKSEPPAVAEAGLRLLIVGVGPVMGNVTAVDGVPPVFTAVMLAFPTVAIKLAGTVAVNWAELTNVVESPPPFHCTVAPERKPDPLTVSVKPAPPAVAEVGLRLLIVGVGPLMGNATAVDGVPPVFTAVMLALPALAIRLAGTTAVNSAELTNAVESVAPFHCTVAPERKLVPLTVNVNPAPPAVAEVGLKLLIVGVGALMRNATAVEGVPPLLTAEMLALPALAIKLAGTVAINSVELTNVVESPAPFHCTVAPGRKPVPSTSSVKPDPPAVAELGFRPVITGAGGADTVYVTGIAIGAPGVVVVSIRILA